MDSSKLKGNAMRYTIYTNEELVRIVDNTAQASELERELANRLDALLAREAQLDNAQAVHRGAAQ
jgi:hypothetical protein